jgi:threonine dehydrogenase-like Zn-dependent dehydrogenase
MRQLTFLAPGRLERTNAPDPSVHGDHGALIRPLAVARCDLDARMVADGLFPGPYPVGHEVAGEVVAVGSAVRRHHRGDRVLVPFQPSCGTCRACREQRFAACHTYRARAGAAFGFGAAGGGHGGAVADLLAVPHADHLLIPAPPGIAAEVLCTLPDNVTDGYRAVAPPLAARPGADVLVVGGAAASIGLYAVAIAVALGAGRVRYIDSNEQRCRVADQLGAVVERHDGPWPRRFERAAITVGNTDDPAGLAAALRSTDDYGVCTSTAIFFGPTPALPLLELYTKGITLQLARADSRRYLPAVLDLVTDGRLHPEVVTSAVAGWADAAAAWLTPAIKLVLTRGDHQAARRS